MVPSKHVNHNGPQPGFRYYDMTTPHREDFATTGSAEALCEIERSDSSQMPREVKCYLNDNYISYKGDGQLLTN